MKDRKVGKEILYVAENMMLCLQAKNINDG